MMPDCNSGCSCSFFMQWILPVLLVALCFGGVILGRLIRKRRRDGRAEVERF